MSVIMQESQRAPIHSGFTRQTRR